MHTAVERAVRAEDKASFAYRAIGGNERRHGVLRTERRRDRDLRIRGRSRAASRRLAVTPDATVEIESRAQSVAHALRFREVSLAVVEEIQFACAEIG